MTVPATLQVAAGIATGVGSLPGDDPMEACRLVLGELPDLPHLPELPGRGPGADMIGRTAALLVDLAVDLQPSGWRLVPNRGIDLRRGSDFLSRDLDALEEVAEGYTGLLKVQATGPWTLAGSVELPRGDKVIADPGATRDLRESLTEGLRLHLAQLRRRVPGASLLLQLDEPSLPMVLAGRVPTASGYGTLRTVEEQTAVQSLAAVLDAVDTPVLVHCCAAGAPLDLLRRAGAAGLSIDASLLRPADDDALGVAVEAGLPLFLGVVPGTDRDLSTVDRTADVARRLWHRLGFAPDKLGAGVVLQPSCGLAGASPEYARRALRRVRDAARILTEEPEPG
ncbi:MAG TPA: methionine synthase [Mycobacteriales bacterium]|nr:methionine synthase [Mycobacteriales bacterium]